MGTIAEKLQAILNSKAAIKAAIEDKGITVADAPLSDYAEKIGNIIGELSPADRTLTEIPASAFEGISTIPANAFRDWRYLTTVNIPSTIRTIEESAFEGCVSLTTINYGARVDNWNNAVIKEKNWNANTGNYTVYCDHNGLIEEQTKLGDWLTDGGFDGGDGTAARPYQVATAGQWLHFANYINEGGHQGEYFKLTQDIVFNQDPMAPDAVNIANYMIGNQWNRTDPNPNSFVGTFDGCGHTLSGVLINRGDSETAALFASTAAGHQAIIKNLIIENSYFKGNASVGAVVGQTAGGKTILENIYVHDSVTIESTGTKCGGLIGHTGGNGYAPADYPEADYEPQVEIYSCINGATVTATGIQYIGGILGNGNGFQITLTDCLNYGNITGGSNYVSGICGRDDTTAAVLTRCVNIGTVTSSTAANAREIIISNSGTKTPTLINCFGLTGKTLSKNTLETDCGDMTLTEFISAEFLDNQGSILADTWIEYANYDEFEKEICYPKNLSAILTDIIPTKYAEYA